jgi:hypothetical protein
MQFYYKYKIKITFVHKFSELYPYMMCISDFFALWYTMVLVHVVYIQQYVFKYHMLAITSTCVLMNHVIINQVYICMY